MEAIPLRDTGPLETWRKYKSFAPLRTRFLSLLLLLLLLLRFGVGALLPGSRLHQPRVESGFAPCRSDLESLGRRFRKLQGRIRAYRKCHTLAAARHLPSNRSLLTPGWY